MSEEKRPVLSAEDLADEDKMLALVDEVERAIVKLVVDMSKDAFAAGDKVRSAAYMLAGEHILPGLVKRGREFI